MKGLRGLLDITDVLVLGGLACVVAGLWMIAVPAALIFLGIAMSAAGLRRYLP